MILLRNGVCGSREGLVRDLKMQNQKLDECEKEIFLTEIEPKCTPRYSMQIQSSSYCILICNKLLMAQSQI